MVTDEIFAGNVSELALMIELQQVTKRYGEVLAVDGVSLTVQE